MAVPATNAQIQVFVDQRMRPRCEQVRALLLAMQDDKLAIDDVYAALSGSPTWVDSRTDGVPHLLVGGDVLAFNSFLDALIAAITGNAQYPVVRSACVQPVRVP
jgi:hypothetical protein